MYSSIFYVSDNENYYPSFDYNLFNLSLSMFFFFFKKKKKKKKSLNIFNYDKI